MNLLVYPYLECSDGIYGYEFTEDGHADSDGEDVTVKKYQLQDLGTNIITVKTKDLDFGNPGLVKKVKSVYVTCRDNGEDTDLALKYYNGAKWTNIAPSNAISSSSTNMKQLFGQKSIIIEKNNADTTMTSPSTNSSPMWRPRATT